jgi:anaerobic selenocysteine-containing dehydrogenase
MLAAEAIVVCWAMGLTQHRNAVATIKEIVNVAAAAGQHRQAGRRPVPGARPLQRAGRPHDGHLGEAAGLPRRAARRVRLRAAARARHDTVDAIRAMRDGKAEGLHRAGRQLRRRHPRHRRHRGGDARCRADRAVSTKLNRSHVVHRPEALILPTLGRTEKDLHRRRRAAGHRRGLDVAVHASRGPAGARRPLLRSEVDIVCGIARPRSATGTASRGATSPPTTTVIRERIGRVVPGCADYNREGPQPGGFTMPHPPRDSRTFPTRRARPSSRSARWRC